MAARSLTLVKTTPTREDMVMRDDYDPLMATAVAARPARERPFQAVRRALTETLAQLADHEVAIVRERTRSCSRCRHYGRACTSSRMWWRRARRRPSPPACVGLPTT